MGPSKTGFWLSLGRMAALIVAVVQGNLLLQGLPVPGGMAEIDLYALKRAEIEAGIRMDALFPPPLPAIAEAASVAENAPAVILLDPETLPFVWVDPPLAPAPRAPGTPVVTGEIDLPEIKIELPQMWTRRREFDILFTWGDALLSVPEAVLDGAVKGAKAMTPETESTEWRTGDSEGITLRLLDFQPAPRIGGVFSEFLGCWVEREQRFFTRFGESPVDTYGIENGTEEVDAERLFMEQRKVVWDALRKTAFSKYKVKAEERFREEALSFREWRGLDFVLLPPLMAAYVCSRGVDRNVSMGSTEACFTIEPVWRMSRGGEECAAALGMEWKIKDFPVGLIVTAGRYGSGWELDFVGIGTSIGMAQRALDVSRGF